MTCKPLIVMGGPCFSVQGGEGAELAEETRRHSGVRNQRANDKQGIRQLNIQHQHSVQGTAATDNYSLGRAN